MNLKYPPVSRTGILLRDKTIAYKTTIMCTEFSDSVCLLQTISVKFIQSFFGPLCGLTQVLECQQTPQAQQEP